MFGQPKGHDDGEVRGGGLGGRGGGGAGGGRKGGGGGTGGRNSRNLLDDVRNDTMSDLE